MGLSAGAWLLDVVPITMHIQLGLPHPLTFGLPHCICVQPLDLMGFTFCGHGGEKTASHDVVQDAFEFIVKDGGFHVLCEQTHVLSPLAF